MKYAILLILSILLTGCFMGSSTLNECTVSMDGRTMSLGIICNKVSECEDYAKEQGASDLNGIKLDCTPIIFTEMENSDGIMTCTTKSDCIDKLPRALMISELFEEVTICEDKICKTSKYNAEIMKQYYFSIGPAGFLPERCTAPAGLDCLDKAAISTEDIKFVIRNNLGFAITNLDIISGTDDCASIGTETIYVENDKGEMELININDQIPNGRKIRIDVPCDGLSEGRIKTDFTIQYTNVETSIIHKGTIQITGVVS